MMLTRRQTLFAGTAAIAVLAFGRLLRPLAATAAASFEVTHTDEEWRKFLSPEAYQVLRHEGTERPFTSALLNEHRAGKFACAGCDLPLYSSKTKFESGTGWPSFWAPLDNAVIETKDTPLACCARQSRATAAAAISATSSTTARNPRDCATA